MISRSRANIPRVILGLAYIGCFGGIYVRFPGLAFFGLLSLSHHILERHPCLLVFGCNEGRDVPHPLKIKNG